MNDVMYRQLLFLFLALLFLVGCTVSPEGGQPQVQTALADSPTSVPTVEPTRPKLIKFYANWCIVCKEMHPTVQSIRAFYGDALDFKPYDIDDPTNEPLRKKYNYRVQPYFVLLDGDENVVQTWQGHVSEQEFKQAIDQLVSQ